MKKIIETDYSGLDRPEILMNLFHPRSEWNQAGDQNGGEDAKNTLCPQKKSCRAAGLQNNLKDLVHSFYPALQQVETRPVRLQDGRFPSA